MFQTTNQLLAFHNFQSMDSFLFHSYGIKPMFCNSPTFGDPSESEGRVETQLMEGKLAIFLKNPIPLYFISLC